MAAVKPLAVKGNASGEMASGDFVDVPYGGTGDTGTAWIADSVTPTAASGTLGSATANRRYKTIGKTVFIAVQISISSNGSGAGGIVVPLPYAAAGAGINYVLAGRDFSSTGNMLQGGIPASASSMTVNKYDNSYPGGSGYVLYVSGTYERA